MRLLYLYSMSAVGLISALWAGGVSALHLLIVGGLLVFHASFQIWVRGNVQWSREIDRDAVKSRIPWSAYSGISNVSLLAIVLTISVFATA
ncbi:hypothetical protein HBDW_12580 [Herbaspirillum sp. DW155]|uniref:hypothetical protein n=1 Tax=Herbaspirillum sp. DW155 TaxID=3095609 RepID=UPI0030855D84|nr:hypothetical protein HBDW_12580 [Herbaspirillum sp. DW155]